MTYQSIFISSELEEKRRRDLLSGSRSFYFLGTKFHYAYSPKLTSLKEGVIGYLNNINNLLYELGNLVKNEYLNSSLKEEISSSCLIDGCPHLRRLEDLYINKKDIGLIRRENPIKNLSLKAGFTVSSPCKGLDGVSEGLEALRNYLNNYLREDLLICGLLEHFFFEYIHPYKMMNGLVGRYMLYERFHGSFYSFIGCRFSSYFAIHLKEYFISFKRAEQTLNLNEYLELILETIVFELEKDYKNLLQKASKWREGLREIDTLKLKTGEYETLKGILMMKIFRSQKLNLSRLAALLGKSERTVFRHSSMALEYLEKGDFDLNG